MSNQKRAYNNESIKALNGVDRVRLRPGVGYRNVENLHRAAVAKPNDSMF